MFDQGLTFEGKDLKMFLHSFCFYEDKYENMQHKDSPEKRGKKTGHGPKELSGPDGILSQKCIKALYDGAEKYGIEGTGEKSKRVDEEYDPDTHTGYYWKFFDDPVTIVEWAAAHHMETLFKERLRSGYPADIDTVTMIEDAQEAFEKADIAGNKPVNTKSKSQKKKKAARKK